MEDQQTHSLLVNSPPPTIAEVINSLPGRENQITQILGHIGAVNKPMPPLFISGPQNTGKTSTVLRIFESLNRPLVYVTCAGFKTPPTRLLNYNPKRIVAGNNPPIFENILRGMSYLENRNKIGHPGVVRKDIINSFMDLFKTSLENTLANRGETEGKMVYLVIDDLQVLHQWFGSRSVAARLISELCNGFPNLGVVLVSSHSRVPTRTWNVSHRVQFQPYENHDAWLRQMETSDLDDAVAAFKDKIVPPKLLGFRCSVHHLNRNIINQKEEGICVAVATAEAMTTAHRMISGDGKLQLSPQPLIDDSCQTFKKAGFMVTNEALGIQANKTYHFPRIRRGSCRYQRGRHFHLDGYNVYNTRRSVKAAIMSNFGAGGSRIPMNGGCKLGPLSDRELACKAYFGYPYRHRHLQKQIRKKLKHEVGHAVTITGMDTRSNNPRNHYVILKNSYGKHWGYRGFTRVSFAFFQDVAELVKS